MLAEHVSGEGFVDARPKSRIEGIGGVDSEETMHKEDLCRADKDKKLEEVVGEESREEMRHIETSAMVLRIIWKLQVVLLIVFRNNMSATLLRMQQTQGRDLVSKGNLEPKQVVSIYETLEPVLGANRALFRGNGLNVFNECIVRSVENVPRYEDTLLIDGLVLDVGPAPVTWNNLCLCNDLEQHEELENCNEQCYVAVRVVLLEQSMGSVVVVR
ncbi:hypothetical protein B0H14DRAFT_2645568 [Mycena olivaceomarginata]|nr:hypothetical protein B0H14DRAFT_2645568 [Mycena olivaceomarginata]